LLHFGDHDPNIAENLLFSIRASVSSRSNLSIVKTNFLSQIARRSNQLIPPGRVIRMAAALGILLAALAFSSSHAATVTTNGFDLFVNELSL
jgi:NAD(P)H-dependent flavin oxidoreductase YrpB (nitropropane dioxygenase family)